MERQKLDDRPTRVCLRTVKAPSVYGSHYVHVELTPDGRPCGGGISTPGKQTEKAIHELVEALSAALDEALKG